VKARSPAPPKKPHRRNRRNFIRRKCDNLVRNLAPRNLAKNQWLALSSWSPQIVRKSTPDPDRPLFDLFPEAYS
jgi:hypothetical protein